MTRIQIRRDTSTNWSNSNPTLSSGEFGYETDTKQLKIGDGSTAWNNLTKQPTPSDISTLTSSVNTINTNLNGLKFWTGTQTEYDSIATKDSATLYIITG